MKKLFKTIGGIVFYIFIAAVFGWTASLTLAEVKAILPNDPITPYFALFLFDGGAATWFLVFIGHARGMLQRATALLMLVLDLAGVVILSAGRILTGGQDMAAVSSDLGAVMVYSLIAATIINLIAAYVYHVADPDTLNQIEMQTLDDMLHAEAMSQAQANIESQVQELAAVMAMRATARLKYRLRLPMSAGEAGEIVNEEDDSAPAPLVIPAEKRKSQPAGIPTWLLNLRRKFARKPAPVATYEQNIPAPITGDPLRRSQYVPPQNGSGEPQYHPIMGTQAQPEPTAEEGPQAHAPAPFRGDGISE